MLRAWSWRRGKSEENAWPLHGGENVRLDICGTEWAGAYSARVRSVGFRRTILEGAEAPIPARTPVTISYVRGDALYRFETQANGPAKAGMVTVANPRRVARIQRRRYYRLPLEAPTTFRVLTGEGRFGSDPIAGRLVNLSGGGALLAAPKPIPGGLELSVRIPAGRDGSPLNIDAEALDCRIASRGQSRIYLVRLRFFEAPRLADADREEILAYLAEQQRLMLRARKLMRA